MPIRRATVSEQPRMAQIAAEAFWDDETFGPLIHPYRNEYPDDMHLFWLSRMRQDWDSPYIHFFALTVPASDGRGEEIVAWAQWNRKGKAFDLSESGHTQPSTVTPSLNRALDPRYEFVLEGAYEAASPLEWTGERAECWDIAWLAVLPAYQHRGYGKALMQFGIEQATNEQVPLSVIAAWGKDGFYNKLGYREATGSITDGENNPLKDKIKGGRFWWKTDHMRGVAA